MVQTETSIPRKPSKVEGIKERSDFLREPVATEIGLDTTHFTEDGIQILKFHGSYQQDNRDNRVKGQEKDYQFMLRTRNPGGYIPPELYLTLDRLAEEYGNKTLRATTRQGFQIHGILKKNLKTVFKEIIQNMGSTLGACGDLNRNIMAPPAPYKEQKEYLYAWEYANNIADLLTPQTGAYYEIWLDGEKAVSAEEAPEVKAARAKGQNGTIFTEGIEPIYGAQYMPRKFKCSVTVPGDNSVDIYTHDISLVVMTNEQGELEGFNILAGGGLGRSHNKEETFPRMADPIGYIKKELVYDLVKGIIATQRDYGDRTDRRHARMKYLLNDWGVEKFRTQVAEYLGQPLEPFRSLPEWKYQDYLGWQEQGDGKLFFGLSIINGRVKDEGSFQLRTGLRKIIEQYNLPMRLTPNHNIILYEIEPEDKEAIEKIFSQYGIISHPIEIPPLVRYSMACPALPTCGLAITESERVLPSIIERIKKLLVQVGLPDSHFVIRMTGCPNGCARPYMAELGLVGSAPNAYQIWLGGTPNQTRLAEAYLEKCPDEEIEKHLEPLLIYFKQEKKSDESFGEFCARVGLEELRSFANSYELSPSQKAENLTPSRSRKNQNRVSVPDELFARLKNTAQEQKRPMNQILAEALEAYLKQEN